MGNVSEPTHECTFCNGTEDLKPLGKQYICVNCRKQIKEMDSGAAPQKAARKKRTAKSASVEERRRGR